MSLVIFAWPVFASESLPSFNMSDAYVYPIYVPTPIKPKPADGYCVSFVKAMGFAKYNGDAREWLRFANSEVPVEGGVVILDESKLGHLAIITDVSSKSLELVEQNYVGYGIVSTRSLDRFDKDIIGYIAP